MANRILVKRLGEFIDPWRGLGISNNQDLSKYDLVSDVGYIKNDNDSCHDSKYHYGRIRFFVERLQGGYTLDPLEVDNRCSRYSILPEPILLDGHHRLAALILAGTESIKVNYGGRLDVLRYLQGKRKNPPQ